MELRDKIMGALKKEPIISVVVRFNTQRTQYPNSTFVFVEGPSDKKFYSSTKISKLRTDLYFFSVKDDYIEGDKVILGKKSVLECYTTIKKMVNIGSSFKQCIFIIDRDYDPNMDELEPPVFQEDKDRLSMTVGHSFENYFLEEDNLQKLFSYYSLSESDLNEYKAHFAVFAEKAIKFFAALSTITHFYYESKHRYKSGYGVESVFNNNILIDEGIDVDHYRYEYQNMMDYIRQDKKYMEHYKANKGIIAKNPALYIRGHNCYYHLEKYLEKRFHIYLAADYRRIAKLFDICFVGYCL